MKKCVVVMDNEDFQRIKSGEIVKTDMDGVPVVIVSALKYFEKDKEKTEKKDAEKEPAVPRKPNLDYVIIRSHVKIMVKDSNVMITRDAMDTLNTVTKCIILDAVTIAKETAQKQSSAAGSASTGKRIKQIIVPVTVDEALKRTGVKK